jgi:hypothetical protein
MPKITDDQIAVLNPFTYTAGYDFAPLAKGLVKGAAKIGKTSIKGGKKIGKLAKPILSYSNDVIQTSKEAGKLKLPTYKDVYRAEHAGFDKVAQADDLTGRWFGDSPEEVDFYVRKLKDPVTGELVDNTNASVRILKGRLPEYKFKQKFGAGMPEEAKIMSMGRGDLTNAELDKILGPGAGKRFTKGTYTHGDLNAMSTAPFLFRKEEGILNPNLVNQLRKNAPIFSGKKEALQYLGKEHDRLKNLKNYQKYLPFKEGGQQDYVELEIDESDIDKYVKGGYIVEDVD